MHRGTDWLNAAPFFYKRTQHPRNEKVPELHRYIAGGTLGGPLIKDKLFGFVSYQHIHDSDQEIGTSRTAVPFGLTDDRSPHGVGRRRQHQLADGSRHADMRRDFAPGSHGPGDINPVAYAMLNYKLPNGQYLIPVGESGFHPDR